MEKKWKKNAPVNAKIMAVCTLLIARGPTSAPKKRCPFKMEFGVTNTKQFEKEGGKMICKGCGKVGSGKLRPGSAVTFPKNLGGGPSSETLFVTT